jgi:sedoheptulokinase
MQMKSCIIGIDFGTTSLSAVIVNVEDLKIEKVLSYNTNAYIEFPDPNRKEQSIEKLTSLFNGLLYEINSYQGIRILAYGFTGQMHGIIGLNRKKEAVTNLVTWQDRSGDTILPNGKKLLDEMKELAGVQQSIANGYGIVTLYKWLKYDNRDDIYSFCTVADYFARLLAGNTGEDIIMSPTMAHSIGLFDVFSNSWQEQAIKNLKLDSVCFPVIKSNTLIVGHFKSKVNAAPVVCAIGDNQSSFMGSVINQQESILLNVGTGTQLSFLISKKEHDVFGRYIDGYETQLRPYDDNSYLMATSFVNGGSVYKSLFNFFKDVGRSLFDLKNIDEDLLWSRMSEAGKRSLANESRLNVSPLLEGQRKNADIKGNISNLSTANFYSGDLILGFLRGLAKYYKTGYFPELKNRISQICGSGNGLKKNLLFCEIIEEEFGHQLYFPPYNEEAAMGAVLNAAKAIGLLDTKEQVHFFLKGLSTHVEYTDA